MLNLYSPSAFEDIPSNGQSSTYLEQFHSPRHGTLAAQVPIAQNIAQVPMHEYLVGQYIQRERLQRQAIRASHPQDMRLCYFLGRDEGGIEWHNIVLLVDDGVEVERHVYEERERGKVYLFRTSLSFTAVACTEQRGFSFCGMSILI